MADEQKVEETKAQEQAATKTEEKKPSVELSDKLGKILKSIEDLTVIELSNLVKALEEKFGVSAQAAVAVAAPGAVAGAAGGAAEEEKTSFDVILTSAGDKKIQVIKEIRAITSLGLKEAKDLVEGAPKPVKTGLTKEEADKIKATLETAGAKIEIK